MIAVFSVVCLVGIFIAGHIFEIHTTLGLGLLAGGFIGMGLALAIAETHGFEGQHIRPKEKTYRWETLFLDVVRLAIDRGIVQGKEPIYVWTHKDGYQPVKSIFTARINHEMAIVLDTTVEDPQATFNSLKQGVM